MEYLNRVLPLKPNWSSPVREVFEYKTFVTTSYDGTEDREAGRQEPRVTYEFDAMMLGEGFRRFQAEFVRGPQTPFAVPRRWMAVDIAHHGVTNDPAVLPDVLTLADDTAPWWAAPGQHVVILADGHQEHTTVTGVGNNIVAVTGNLIGEASGARLAPAYLARVESRLSRQMPMAHLATAKVSLDVVPGESPIVSPPAPAMPTHEGLPVFLSKPNWRRDVTSEMQQELQVFDLDFTRNFVEKVVVGPDLVVQLGFTHKTAAQSDALLAFFMAMRGKRGEFWTPSWAHDLAVVGSGTNVLSVEGGYMHSVYEGHPVFNRLIARWPDGAWQINRVMEIADSVGVSDLTMEDDWIADPTTAIVQFCVLARSAADRLEIVHLTSTVSESTFTVKSLPNGHLDDGV